MPTRSRMFRLKLADGAPVRVAEERRRPNRTTKRPSRYGCENDPVQRTPDPPYPATDPGRRGDERSRLLVDRARRVTPGGVNSPVRAVGAVGGTPRFVASAYGPYLVD